jgi:hypothetical protein
VLRCKKTPVVEEYIHYRIKKLQKILETLEASNSRAGEIALLERKRELQALKEVIK